MTRRPRRARAHVGTGCLRARARVGSARTGARAAVGTVRTGARARRQWLPARGRRQWLPRAAVGSGCLRAHVGSVRANVNSPVFFSIIFQTFGTHNITEYNKINISRYKYDA